MPAQSTSPLAPEQELRTLKALRRGEPLPGYLVDSDGRVWSLWGQRELGRISWGIGDIPYELKPYPIGRKGAYLGVALRVGGCTVRTSVHKLVMETFIGPCPDGLEICHADGNGHNNRLDNLRYDTKQANAKDRDGHPTHQRGQQNPSSKLTDDQAEEVRRLRAAGMKLRDIAGRFGIRESTVSRIANGVRRAR